MAKITWDDIIFEAMEGLYRACVKHKVNFYNIIDKVVQKNNKKEN